MSNPKQKTPQTENRYWLYFAERVGGRYEEDAKGHEQVLVTAHGRTVTVDRETVSPWAVFTRYRCRFTSADGFRFSLYSPDIDLATQLRQATGAKDVEIGIPYFDKKFVIEASEQEKIRALLDDPVLREQISELSKIRFEIRADKTLPAGAVEFRFLIAGKIEEITRLHHLFGLFTTFMERLASLGSIAPDP